MYTVSIRLDENPEEARALFALRMAYGDACNRLVPIVQENRLWNRVGLHQCAYSVLREETPLGSQMVCNAIFSVCKAYKSQKALGRIKEDSPVPKLCFAHRSIHYDKRTYTLKKDNKLSLNTLSGRITVPMKIGEHQHRILESGTPKEAELIFRNGKWLFNLVVELKDPTALTSGLVMGVDVGENNLAATSTGKVLGGENLRHERDKYLATRRRLQSNGSQSAKQKLRQVSGKEQRRVKQVNHETSKLIVEEAVKAGVSKIIMEDLTYIRSRIKGGVRIRTRLHRWAFRQLQEFVEYKAKARGIVVEYVNPAFTSQTCSCCGASGKRVKHRFFCKQCGLRAHADLNSSRNLARIGKTAVSPRASVNPPNVEDVGCLVHVSL